MFSAKYWAFDESLQQCGDIIGDKHQVGDSQLIDVCQGLAVLDIILRSSDKFRIWSVAVGNKRTICRFKSDYPMFFDMKKHLTSCIIKKHGNLAAGIIPEKALEFFFCTMQKDPIPPVLHIISRRI
jgi:hypothetical protein